MCAIVAVIGSREAAPLLLEGLRQLEYRGYDSAGIATVNGERQLSCLRAEGKLINLTQRFEASGAAGQCDIGHTRWATHGKPEERNAHPHLDGPGRVAVVQNGIIENYRTLREELQAEGMVFRVNGSSQYPADHPQRPRRWLHPRQHHRPGSRFGVAVFRRRGGKIGLFPPPSVAAGTGQRPAASQRVLAASALSRAAAPLFVCAYPLTPHGCPQTARCHQSPPSAASAPAMWVGQRWR